MVRTSLWVRAEAQGLYVAPADCWIDPSRPVDTALVTHGHADHACGGHGRTVATAETIAIMTLRYGEQAGAGRGSGAAGRAVPWQRPTLSHALRVVTAIRAALSVAPMARRFGGEAEWMRPICQPVAYWVRRKYCSNMQANG